MVKAIDCLPLFFNRKTQIGIDAVLSVVAAWIACQLRFDFNVPANQTVAMWIMALLLGVMRPSCLRVAGVYQGTWRYFDFREARTLALGAVPPTALMLLAPVGSALAFGSRIPLTVVVVDYGVFVALGLGVRGLYRILYEASLTACARKRTLLVGSEHGLVSALRQVSLSPEVSVVGLLSPDAILDGTRISGFKVLGNLSGLPTVLASGEIDLVLVAGADSDSIGEAVETATHLGIEVRLLPSATDIIRGDVRVSAIAKPELALARPGMETSQPGPEALKAFRGRSVLITGAGGSIGSELSRQVAQLPVSQILLLDQDENAIFEIHRELSSTPDLNLVPIVADIRDREHILSTFAMHRPQIVLHAAAYKHVPIMEHNCAEAVLNNVSGTRCLAETALEFCAERFLMISTDKALNPGSIMGATKRVAELVVQQLAVSRRGAAARTLCSCVRFGNVLGSRGSLVPVCLRQIAIGGPVTITDQEMTRYFMTIPEAAHLVLQAAALGSNGGTYILEMGEPVKIATLVRRLIAMSGLRPGTDIEVRLVGARPGEKLHEQLWSDAAQVTSTEFAGVLSIQLPAPSNDFERHLHALETAAMTRDDHMTRECLMKMPINCSSPLRSGSEQEQNAQADSAVLG